MNSGILWWVVTEVLRPLESTPLSRQFSPLIRTLACSTVLATCAACSHLSDRSHLSSAEKMMWSTYPLGTQKGMATGFVVDTGKLKSAKGNDSVSVTVVTSLHAIQTVGRAPLLIATRTVEDDGTPAVVLIQIQQPKGKTLFFVRHPSADIAAFRVRIPAQAIKAVQLPTFLSSTDIPRNRTHVRPGMDVSFLGYPEVLPGTAGAFPILRSGKVASYSPGKLGKDNKFVINADVYPGDSGAPVFSMHDGRAELVGMIIQRIGTASQDFSHLAIAVDSAAIRETLDLLAATNPDELN